RDEETRRARDHAFADETRKERIGFTRRLGIAELAEAHRGRIDPRLDAVIIAQIARRRIVDRTRLIELRMRPQKMCQPLHPIAAPPVLATRHALDAPAEDFRGGAEHLLAIGERHAADEMNWARHRLTSDGRRRDNSARRRDAAGSACGTRLWD